jgi:hypothetical protein
MNESSWFSFKQLHRSYIPFLFAHVSFQQDAAQIVGVCPKTLKSFCGEDQIYFTKPLNSRAGTSPPPNWFLEFMQFLSETRRTGKQITLPRELLVHWAQECCPEVLRPEFLDPPPLEPPRPPPADWPPPPPPQFLPPSPRA